MIESRQIRAARALLNWSQQDLAGSSGIAISSIKNVENDITVARRDTLSAIQDAFEKAGIEFIPGSGVRMKEQTISVLQGTDGYWTMLDDVYHTLLQTGGHVNILGLDETVVSRALGADASEGGEKLTRHITRLQKNRLSERLIIRKGDTNIMAPLGWYRCIPEEFFAPYPLYIYGNKIGIIYWGPPFKAVIYDNPEVPKSLLKLFDFVWHNADPVIINGKR